MEASSVDGDAAFWKARASAAQSQAAALRAELGALNSKYLGWLTATPDVQSALLCAEKEISMLRDKIAERRSDKSQAAAMAGLLEEAQAMFAFTKGTDGTGLTLDIYNRIDAQLAAWKESAK